MDKSSKSKNRKPKGSQVKQKGQKAATTIYSRAKDQLISAARSRYGGKSAISNIMKDISMLKAVLNTENKHVDTLFDLSTNNTLPVITFLGSIAQGTTNNTRIGDSVKLDRIDTNITFTYQLGTPATSATMCQIYRWFIVKYLKTPSSGGSSAFAIGDFLNNDVNGQVTPLSLPNTDLSEDFHIIDSGLVELVLPYLGTVNSIISKTISMSENVSFHQTFNGSAGSNIVDNALFLVVVSQNGNNAGASANVYVGNRIWYVDN